MKKYLNRTPDIKMLRGLLIFLFVVFCNSSFYTFSAPEERKVAPPKQLDYGELTLKYNPAWKNKEIYLEVNLNEDAEKEIILGFVASYWPSLSSDLKSDGLPVASSKQKQLPPIENHAFYQIYHRSPRGSYELIKTFTGMDQLGKIEIIKLGEKEPPAIVLFNPGGENYIDLSIYQWREGGFRLLFNDGSSSKITLNTNEKPIAVHVERSSEEGTGSNEDIFAWDDSTKSFRRLKPH